MVARIKHNKRQDAAVRRGEMSLDVYETPDGFLHDGHGLGIIDPETGEEAKGWDAGYWTIEEKLADCSFKNVGKRAAGRLLDKREWNEMPKVKK